MLCEIFVQVFEVAISCAWIIQFQLSFPCLYDGGHRTAKQPVFRKVNPETSVISGDTIQSTEVAAVVAQESLGDEQTVNCLGTTLMCWGGSMPWQCRIASDIPSVLKKLEIAWSPTKSFVSIPMSTCSPVSIQD